MQQYGFLPYFPIACVRNGEKHLIVQDGQHRLAFAEKLGLPVFYMVDQPFDIARVNGTQEKWATRNYAETFAAQGKQAYAQGLEFADRHGISVGVAFALLAGTTQFTNTHGDYYTGNFKIKDQPWAETVAAIYGQIVKAAPRCRNARLIEAAMAVARVDKFDVQRLLGGIDRCREKLIPYATKEAYLDMLEEIYNYGRKQLVGLKVEAINAMRARNAVISSKTQKENAK
jgi:hypothetical protein